MSDRIIEILPPGSQALPLTDPALFDGVTLKRIIAYALDWVVVVSLAGAVWFAFFMLGVLSFGLLFPLQALAVALVPIAYHSLMIAGPRSATLGMRVAGLQVRSVLPESAQPSLAQAIILTVAFYGSVAMTASLVLIVALFNPRRRCLHDMLAGTVVINGNSGV